MADIRIKDLTTLAPSAVSDDYLAIDGTTNGTRKLSAFSPSFGGNATVGGTLTVNSSSIVNGSASGATSYLQIKNNGSSIGLLGSRNAIDGGTATDVGLYVYGANALTLWTNSSVVATFASNGNTTLAGALSVSSTTASTSTSSGALVVGNGTSGGLGVGGSIYAGGSLALVGTASSIATNSADSMLRVGTGLSVLEQCVTLGLSRRLNYGDALISRNLQGQSGTDAYITSSTSIGGYGGFEIQYGGVARILVGSGATTANAVVTPTVAASFTTTTAAVSTVLQVTNTTASTSTSSGALVVSGGVGVAGAIYVGGDVVGNANLVCVATASTNGNIYLRGKGTGFVRVDTGSGFRVETGKVSFTSLPTSSVGLSAGDIWNDSGTLKIV